MHRKVALALVWMGLLAVPAHAQQLTYVTHVEFRKVEMPPPETPTLAPVYANLALWFSRTSARDIPGGSVDFSMTLNSREMRVQASVPTGELSDGTMVVVHSNHSAVFANPASKTFWRIPEPPAVLLAAQETGMSNLNPSVSIKRLGESATIAGVTAEHVTFVATLNPLGVAPSPREQGMNLEVSGEAWLAPEYRSYAALQSRTYPMSPTGAPLLRQLDDIGFPMRLIIRGDILGGHEIERTVTKIAEEPATVFDVPPGYTETYRLRPNITAPQKIKDVTPAYTAEAMRARVQGEVLLEVVVGVDGMAREIRVLRSLGAPFGLDEAAINAVRQWEFTPALLDGKPVSVMVTVAVAFKIRFGP